MKYEYLKFNIVEMSVFSFFPKMYWLKQKSKNAVINYYDLNYFHYPSK